MEYLIVLVMGIVVILSIILVKVDKHLSHTEEIKKIHNEARVIMNDLIKNKKKDN